MKSSIDREKEIIEIRKLYLIQFEKFEAKVFFSLLTIFLSLFVLYLKTSEVYAGIATLIFGLLIMFSDSLIQLWRENNFNKLIEDINNKELLNIKFNLKLSLRNAYNICKDYLGNIDISLNKIKVRIHNSRKAFNRSYKKNHGEEAEGIWLVGFVDKLNKIHLISQKVFWDECYFAKEDYAKIIAHEMSHIFLNQSKISKENHEPICYYIANQRGYTQLYSKGKKILNKLKKSKRKDEK